MSVALRQLTVGSLLKGRSLSLTTALFFFTGKLQSLSAQEILHRRLERCSSMAQLKLLHAHVVLLGLSLDNFTLGKLISFAGINENGDLQYALDVFNRIRQPNKFMFNSLIRGCSISGRDPSKAIALYRNMLASGHSPNEFTLPFVLKACASEPSYWMSMLVHGQGIKLGIGSHVCVQNALMNVYIAMGMTREARKVFDEIAEKTSVSWNSMIGGYSRAGRSKETCILFRQMRESGVVPDGFTFVSLLSACSQTCDLDLGRFVHLYIEITGLEIDLFVRNALLDMYGKCGHLDSAEKIFLRMQEKNVVSWTTMLTAYAKHGFIESARELFVRMPMKNVVSWNSLLSGYSQNGQCREALSLFDEMQKAGFNPNEATLTTVLYACGQIGDVTTGEKIHAYIRETESLQPSITLTNSLIAMYAKCGEVPIAMDIFRKMKWKNVVSWNAVIGGLALQGIGDDVIELFREMEASGIQPNGITFTGLLAACSHGGLISSGRYYFERMSSVYSIPLEIEHYACMIDLLGRGGLLEEAIRLIGTMPMRPDIVIWGALLGACKIHGVVEIGRIVLKQLLELQPYSAGLCVLLSNLYSEANRWEDMQRIRKIMNGSGVAKCDAISFIEIGGHVYEFMVDDRRSDWSRGIYSVLNQLTDHLKLEQSTGTYSL
ncbi:pentatricopeptide repeat-containing protein At2g29760, chloroplastic-like [Punica granatum]|nr:pentatricopeptide repeat-containing protein At2g29760, chloroplastic-like [Punica granatum]OWM66323.1 hypothetical protein CDL15_Pgr013540 [Punica granatum]